ncbi:helix-turn-helix domain-containing protein [Bartonella krasnovii]|uniref:helix-turn-helix domain-containing protein n=1 Tax=Bartonella krasnovii TaxID=2267275 RepID=UPI001F4C86A0|nr:helix-turn-helix domain-containing protein [Bartonella krasnovii]UNF38373.1 helix-turn-helix domain-containing protein [Bartonella krasnovii]UNF39926.1 helix-turn-helix domain-containing protein [Bartonella krasnovii]UNF46087.1 helix-turn-helix domain-containing protein [Bartonella krasnovii]UNF47864.1 helix-turn-helix domain-containing protein [Bartonella krasnovii]UNF49910.1 helix-turn-helix domain-containing protein [Bartonella krasnovii]
MHEEVYSDFPALLREIADVAGSEAAWNMMRAFGGREVYIPGRLENADWLIEIVGFEEAQQLINHFCFNGSGVRLLIPLGRDAERRQKMMQALQKGWSVDAAAAVSGMHVRTAYRLKKRISLQEPQGLLFPEFYEY